MPSARAHPGAAHVELAGARLPDDRLPVGVGQERGGPEVDQQVVGRAGRGAGVEREEEDAEDAGSKALIEAVGESNWASRDWVAPSNEKVPIASPLALKMVPPVEARERAAARSA